MENRVKGRKRSKSPAVARLAKKTNSTNQQLFMDHEKQHFSIDISEDQSTSLTNATNKISRSPESLCFKNPKYRETGFAVKTKVWKSLKQIMALQKSQSTSEVLYASIDAPPATKPTKKYSDVSGLPAPYMDPNTKLRFSNAREYQVIQHLSSDTIAGFLALRRAAY